MAYPWAEQSAEFIRYSGKTCENVPDVLEFRAKANQVRIRKGKMVGQVTPLQTFIMQEVANWEGYGPYRSSRIAGSIPYAPLGDGYHYDKHGLVIFPEDLTDGQETFPCRYPENFFQPLTTLPSVSDGFDVAGQDSATASSGREMESEREQTPGHMLNSIKASCNGVQQQAADTTLVQENPHATAEKLRPIAKDGHRLRLRSGGHEEGNITRRITSRSTGDHRGKRRKVYDTDKLACNSTLRGNGRSRALAPQSGGIRNRDNDVHHSRQVLPRAGKAARTDNLDDEGISPKLSATAEMQETLLADDCVTDLLLDDFCPASKYVANFQRTESMRHVLALDGRVPADIAPQIAMIIVKVRKWSGLHVPSVEALSDQLRLYLNARSPESLFDFATTTQYSSRELCVLATKHIPAGVTVPFLLGMNTAVPPTESISDGGLGHIDGRCGDRYITAGPLRFVNHDCDPNSNFNVEGSRTVLVTRHAIEEGTEITANYGADYFGQRNQECACRTCKKLRNDVTNGNRKFWPQANRLQRDGATAALPYDSHAVGRASRDRTPDDAQLGSWSVQDNATKPGSALQNFFERAQASTIAKANLRNQWSKLPAKSRRYTECLRFIKPIFVESTAEALDASRSRIASQVLNHGSNPILVTHHSTMVALYQANPPWLQHVVGWYIVHTDEQEDDQTVIQEVRDVTSSVSWVIQGEAGTQYVPESTSMSLRLSKMFSGNSKGSVARLMPQHAWPGLLHNGTIADRKKREAFDAMSLNALAPQNVPERLLARDAPEDLLDLPRFRITRILQRLLKKFWFILVGENGAHTAWHLDILAGARIRAYAGHFAWFITVLRESYRRDGFAHFGTDWQPDPHDVECIPLVAGSELIMCPQHLIAHDVLKLEDSIANGNPLWDSKFLRQIFANLCYIITHELVTNEQIPNDLPEILEAIELELGNDPDLQECLPELLQLKALVRSLIACVCKGGRCGVKCSCRKANRQYKEYGCTPWCSCENNC